MNKQTEKKELRIFEVREDLLGAIVQVLNNLPAKDSRFILNELEGGVLVKLSGKTETIEIPKENG